MLSTPTPALPMNFRLFLFGSRLSNTFFDIFVALLTTIASNSDNIPDWKVQTNEWNVEDTSQWRTEDTDNFFYEIEEKKK